MKRRELSGLYVFFFVFSVMLILLGMFFGLRMFSYLEYLALNHENHAMLLDSVRTSALFAMGFAGMVVAGIGILVVLLLYSVRRSSRIQREADLLRQKNEAMEELNRQTQTLAHHQRLEMLGTLTSSIAHEFNNLLTPIMGYSLLALEKLPPEEEEIYDNILEVYNASRTAKTLISRLSDLSRKNTDDTFRLASADELIQRTLDVAGPARPDTVSVKLDLNCLDQRIRVNEIQISQLLLNLILNAFQAMEKQGGTLTIKTSFDEDYVLIRVSDTGCGIPKENLSRIFDPFFTTKDSGRGTGLGLAIAAQVVEDHQGTIHVTSEPGVGTNFTVAIPRAVI